MTAWKLAVAVLAYLAIANLGIAGGETVRVFGDRLRHPKAPSEYLRLYVDMPKDHDGDTPPLAAGVQFTPGVLQLADDLPVTRDLAALYPKAAGPAPSAASSSGAQNLTVYEDLMLDFPEVGQNPFKFATFTYNMHGHFPAAVYSTPHFGVRLFTVDQEWWWGEQYPEKDAILQQGHSPKPACGGAGVAGLYQAMQPVPAECWPGDPRVTRNMGQYDWGQGAHVYNTSEPGWRAVVVGRRADEVDSLSWGLQGGQVAYVEASFSPNVVPKAGSKLCMDIEIPQRFNAPLAFPTRKCLDFTGVHIKLEFSSFVSVPGGCDDLRNGTLVGYAPFGSIAMLYGKECKVPQPCPRPTPELLAAAAYYYQIYIAWAAATAEQDYETDVLQQASDIASMDFWAFADTVINATYPSAGDYVAARSMVRAATCFCDAYTNTSDPEAPRFTNTMLFLNQSASLGDPEHVFNLTLEQYKANRYYCPLSFDPWVWSADGANGSTAPQLVPLDTADAGALSAFCSQGLATALAWRRNMTDAVRSLLVERRLGNMHSTGKASIGTAVSSQLLAYLPEHIPELASLFRQKPASTSATIGTTQQSGVGTPSARISDLTLRFGDDDLPSKVSIGLLRRSVYAANLTLPELRARAQARVTELKGIYAKVRNSQLPGAPLALSGTVGEVVGVFVAAGATRDALPQMTSPLLAPLGIYLNATAC